MATTDGTFDGFTEYCRDCDLDTLHEVSVQLRTESSKTETAAFSREPYRVSECQRCGRRSSQRVTSSSP